MKLSIKKEPTFFINKDFKTIQIEIIFPFHKKEKDIAKFNILPCLINRFCEKYKTEEELSMVKDENYILTCYCINQSINNFSYFIYSLIIPDTYTLKHNYLEEQFKFLNEFIYHPKVKNSKFYTEDLNKEKESLCYDIQKTLNDVESYAILQAKQELDTNSIFTKNIFNHMDQISKLNEKNLYEYYLNTIKNNQPMVYVFGNCNQEEIKKLCKKYIYQKEYQNTYINIKPREYLIPKKETKNVVEKSSFHNSIYISFYTVKNMKRKDELYLSLVNQLLASSTSRLLNKKLRDENELVYSTYTLPYYRHGVLGICSTINKKDIKIVKEKTKEVVNELKNIEMIKPLLEGIKNDSRLSLIRSLDDKAFLFGDSIKKDMKHDYSAIEYHKKISSIKAEEVAEFINKLVLDTTYFLEEGEHE